VKPRAFHPEADEEYANAAEYYTRIEPELGQRFYDEIERLILDLRRQPERFGLFDHPIRRHFSDLFPYAVLYVDQPDRVLIVAVMHMKRRPGYWKHRLG
jgi:plasmid stabilization system protein ParE